MKTVSDKVVRHLLVYMSVQKWLVGNVPFYVKICGFWPTPYKTPIFNLYSLEKSSVNTNRKSTMRFPMSPRWTSYVATKPEGRSKTQCPNFEQWAAITPIRYEIGCQLVLMTSKKSHTGFRLVLTLMILNYLERRNSPFCIFHRIRFAGSYVRVVEYRLIISINIVSQFQSSTVGHN